MPVQGPPDSGTRVLTAKEKAAAAAAVERRRQELMNIFSKMDTRNEPTESSSMAAPATAMTAGAAAGGRKEQRWMGGPPASQPARPERVSGAGERDGASFAVGSGALAGLGGGATFTRSGRPVILSANSRRLPRVFSEQQQTAQQIDSSLGNVAATLQKLTYDLSRATDIQLPPETVAAVEENHRAFTDSLALRSGRDGDGGSGGVGSGGLFLPYRLRGKKTLSDWLMKLQRARAAAADECLVGDQSVVDYAADAVVPRLTKGRRMQEELEAMGESLGKILECAAAMRVDVSGNPNDATIPGLAPPATNATTREFTSSSAAAAASPLVERDVAVPSRSTSMSTQTLSQDNNHPQHQHPHRRSPSPLEPTISPPSPQQQQRASLPLAATRASTATTTTRTATGAPTPSLSYDTAGASSVPWWSSALRTRDLKAHAIRLNYHARRALQWDWRCREHVLLQAAYLNHSSAKCREDLVRLQSQLSSFAQRFTDSEEMIKTMQAEIAVLQDDLAEAAEERAELQEKMVALAEEEGWIARAKKGEDGEGGGVDPLGAELVLLLARHAWPTALREDAGRVLQWLRTEDVSLE